MPRRRLRIIPLPRRPDEELARESEALVVKAMAMAREQQVPQIEATFLARR